MSKAKDKAKRFIRHLLDSGKDDTEYSSLPQKHDSHNLHSATPPINDSLVQSFSSLAVSDSPQCHSESAFIGGFHPGHMPANHPQPQKNSTIPVTPPSAMPVPWVPPGGRYSLTMQMALQPDGDHLPLPGMPSHLGPPSAIQPSLDSTSVPSTSHSTSQTTPTKPNISQIPSTPTSPSQTVSQQCAGVTKAGNQCTRRVKSGPALSQALGNEEPADGDNHPIERFCFQHTKELLGPSGYYARKNGVWVDFEDWIPAYLQPDTQVALRAEMEKSRSPSDVYGYIYTFEIRGDDGEINLKVGRAVNLVKRIDQWGKQCGSKEQVLRGWYPGTVESDDSEGSLMKGRVKAGDKAPWCHRMERLIHLELADLVATSIYLDPAWPHPAPINVQTGNIKKYEPCTDCGTVHKEIFPFKRLRGHCKGKEWELVVQPVIDRWGRFVRQFV